MRYFAILKLLGPQNYERKMRLSGLVLSFMKAVKRLEILVSTASRGGMMRFLGFGMLFILCSESLCLRGLQVSLRRKALSSGVRES